MKDSIYLKRVNNLFDSKQAIKELLVKNEYNFNDLCNLVSVLRSEDGCPWDREQTNKSIRNCFIDETYEFIEGLDNDDDALMCEELGDVLFQIIFHSDIKMSENKFDINKVIDGICKKMILRHPHVFGDTSVENSSEVLVNWENIKNHEKKRKSPYEQLDSVAKSLPSLMRAQKLLSKAEKNDLVKESSFDDKINEIQKCLDSLKNSKNTRDAGKLLFSAAGVCKQLGAEAEEILYIENESFLANFR